MIKLVVPITLVIVTVTVLTVTYVFSTHHRPRNKECLVQKVNHTVHYAQTVQCTTSNPRHQESVRQESHIQLEITRLWVQTNVTGTIYANRITLWHCPTGMPFLPPQGNVDTRAHTGEEVSEMSCSAIFNVIIFAKEFVLYFHHDNLSRTQFSCQSISLIDQIYHPKVDVPCNVING